MQIEREEGLSNLTSTNKDLIDKDVNKINQTERQCN